MLAIRYKDEFIKKDKNKDLESVMDRVVEKEKEYNTPCTNWTTEQVEGFLKEQHSVSPNTISRSLTFLRNFVEYICTKEQLTCPEYKLEFGRLYDLVDYNKLLSQILTFEQYRHIKNQFSSARDKCIFGLAWVGLMSSDEIRKIKDSDIRFEKDKDDMDVAWILVGKKEVKIEDPELIDDLKDCRKEREYVLDSADGRNKRMKFKDTDYLIRPTLVGRKGKDDFISNPTIALQKAIAQQGITCPGIEVTEITVESIRRSKLIFLLSPQNEKYFDKDFIMAMLDSGNVESNLFWLRRVAKIKYKQH